MSSHSYIAKLYSETPEAEQAAIKLTELANESRECREEVIKALIEALNKADFQNYDSAFHLWARGSGILGHLKAVEALDPLIAHLDLNDGLFSASMYHEPVVLAMEEMGKVAVPKLAVSLKHNPDKEIRLAAAFCLSTIGGSEALDALNSALGLRDRRLRPALHYTNTAKSGKNGKFQPSHNGPRWRGFTATDLSLQMW